MKHWKSLLRYLDGQLRIALLAAAEARSRQDWSEAERHYEVALARDPMQPAVILQLGHAQRERGRLHAAEATYRRAIATRPGYPQGYLYLGHILKAQGHSSAAIDAYAQALETNPGFRPARDELIAAGARNRLPETAYGRSAATESLGRISADLDSALAEMRQWLTVSAYPQQAYGAFRKAFPIQPPPGSVAAKTIVIVLDATSAPPSALRRTLASITDQRDHDWVVIVRASQTVRTHSIASMELVDNRVRFVSEAVEEVMSTLSEWDDCGILLTQTGAVLDPETIGWMRYALERSHGLAATCDYDHFQEHWRTGLILMSPVLEGAAEPYDDHPSRPPPGALIVDASLKELLEEALRFSDESEQRRALGRMARQTTTVGRLARLLISLPEATAFSPAAMPATAPDGPPVGEPKSILVVIPTRDQPAVLSKFIESLYAKAAVPTSIRLVVIDNRSQSAEAHKLYARLSRSQAIKVLTADEPFNWSRLNNLATTALQGDILLFANDDIEMLSPEWDRRLREALRPTDVGVVGARLLYANGTLQHGGTILGGYDGRPMHEGVGATANTPGPLGRWIRTRRASSVTGAFLATRREVFEQVGGFTTRLAIAYNDVDFCLKVRSVGLQVCYAADIEATHHESLTRGVNNTPEKIAWDDGELADLYRRWGKDLFQDPTVNPQWSDAPGRPFEGFRDISRTQIQEYLELTSRPNPWHVKPVDTAF